jgi:5-methylcytosine-specific restriction endonuclease McrA
MMRKNKKTKYKQIYIAKPKIEGICGFCEKIFIKNFSHQKFCSRKCIRKPHAQRRFRILKRDKFTCQYCGRKAPFVTLHVDHIIPSSKGGTSEDQNLTTACQDCNLGKSDIFNE